MTQPLDIEKQKLFLSRKPEGLLDREKVIAFVKARITWYYKGDAVWNEFQEFMQKIESGEFDIEKPKLFLLRKPKGLRSIAKKEAE